MEPAWVIARPSEYMLWLLTWWFYETPDSGSVSSSFVCFSLYQILLPSLDVRLCSSHFCTLLCHAQVMPLQGLHFFERDRRSGFVGGGDLGTYWEEWREVKLQ